MRTGIEQLRQLSQCQRQEQFRVRVRVRFRFRSSLVEAPEVESSGYMGIPFTAITMAPKPVYAVVPASIGFRVKLGSNETIHEGWSFDPNVRKLTFFSS